jgi:hypothetical protein
LSRVSILKEIMELENEIKKIQHDSIYRKIVRHLRSLKSISNRGYITVPSPKNFEVNLRVRKDSDEMVKVLNEYQNKYDKLSGRLLVLQNKRSELKNKIFS